MAEPTAAHRATVALHRAGHLKRWFQQNHDGLPQKAGLPQAAINEIHGSWYDPSNPVVNMAGQLREDLFADLLDWEGKADVCLALGTSMAGMNADRLCASVAKRAGGLVIVNLQRTSLDDMAAVRVFATLDVVMEKLAAELGCVVPGPAARVEHDEDAAVFTIATADGGTTELDLRPDAQIQLHGGRFDGAIGEVAGCDRQGNFNLRVKVSVNSKSGFKAVTPLKLGRWWTGGGCGLPVTNVVGSP